MRSGGGAVPFSIADLFASSEQGAWYGPSDIDTLFQDSAGTTPVTTAGQPVGLMLDKSKGLVRGPELVTNGDFATDTDWLGIFGGTNLTIAEGQATFTTSANYRGAFQTVNYAAGTLLEIMFDIVSVSAGDVQFVGKTSDDGTTGGTPFSLSASSSGSYKAIVLTNGSVNSIAIRNTNSGSTTVIDNVSVRELLGNHAVQATAAARPTYETGPARATLDKVDDRLSVTVPTGGFTGTMVLATDQGTASYGVNIPAGPYDIGGQYFPGNAIVGQVIRNGALSARDAAATEAYFVENGATASYGAVTDFGSFWRDWSEITSFPLIDTSAGTNFTNAWRECSSLTSFPLIDTSAGTDFQQAWRDCRGLTSFPLIDTSSGDDFFAAWLGCSGLTSFPLIDTSSGYRFQQAWRDCRGLTSFPLIDTSAGASFNQAWYNCSSLTSFPANAFDNVKGGDFTDAFTSTALTQTSIDNILVSLVTSGIATGTRVFDQSGGSAPSSTGEAAIDTLRSRGWTVTVTGGYSPSDLSTLFQDSAGGIAGAWYGPSDLSTLFQDSAGTTPVTTAGQPVGLMLDNSGNDNHATQATAAARPIYQTGPARATIDKVDDRLSVTVPAGGFTGTMVLGTDQGTASYGVTIPAGAYDIGGRDGLYFPGNAIVGQVIRDGALSEGEAAAIEAYFVENGATASYGAVTDFSNFWQDWSEITSFPLINTSAGTDFTNAWRGCASLTSFPLIDTSAGTDFGFAWRNCSSLTSFPLIDTSSGTDFRGTWAGCSSLTSFPLIDTSSGNSFRDAWFNCSSLTSFPLIDTSSGNSFRGAWYGCSSLTSFPANAFDNVKGGDFNDAFTNTALTQTSIDNILVSLVASGIATGTQVFDQSGGSAPSSTGEAAIDTLRSRGWTVTVTGGY